MLALDPVDTRNVLEVDDLGMGTEEVVLHDRLDTIGIDAYSLENAGTLIVKQQRVVIHAHHPPMRFVKTASIATFKSPQTLFAVARRTPNRVRARL